MNQQNSDKIPKINQIDREGCFECEILSKDTLSVNMLDICIYVKLVLAIYDIYYINYMFQRGRMRRGGDGGEGGEEKRRVGWNV